MHDYYTSRTGQRSRFGADATAAITAPPAAPLAAAVPHDGIKEYLHKPVVKYGLAAVAVTLLGFGVYRVAKKSKRR